MLTSRNFSGALGYWSRQAEHLAEARCVHLRSINAIFYSRPPPYGKMSFLGRGFLLRCYFHLHSLATAKANYSRYRRITHSDVYWGFTISASTFQNTSTMNKSSYTL